MNKKMDLLSYSFYSYELNKEKYNLLKDKAILIHGFKNQLSQSIFNTFLNENGYLNKKLSRIFIQKEFKYLKPLNISEQMFNSACLEVVTMYNNRKKTSKRPFISPIKFNKLTFSNTNVLSKSKHESILGINNNACSSIKYFLKLSSITDTKGELLHIPVKFSKKYHGNFKEYNTSESNTLQFNTSYIIQFLPKNRLRIILTRYNETNKEFQPEEEIPLGIDVNIKHNLMSFSNGDSIDHHMSFYNKYISFLKYLDRKKSNKEIYNNKEIKLSKRDQDKYNLYLKRLEGIYNEYISYIINHYKNENYNIFVLENLGSLPKSFARLKDEFKGFKVGRLSKLMRLSEIKNIFQRLGNKYQVKIVLVNPAYTSQQCPHCNYISKLNRKTQEMFSCVKCGHEDNADTNAANNILNRYTKYNIVNDFNNYKKIKTFFEDLSLNVDR